MIDRRPLVVVGDALLDRDLDGRVERLSPEAPVPVVDDPAERSRPGGAALAAALAAADGERPVVLVTALGEDDRARELEQLLGRARVEVVDLGLDGPTPEKVRVRGAGRTLLRIDRGGRGEAPVAGDPEALRAARRAIASAAGVLVSDYGRGVADVAELRAAFADLPAETPLVWDPHPRGPEPVGGALLVTPNSDEAQGLADGQADPARAAGELARRWGAAYVCVTRGGEGAVVASSAGAPLAVPVPGGGPTSATDPCGAGDRFASRASLLLCGGELPSAAVTGAVASASAFVAAGGAGAATLAGDRATDRNGTPSATPGAALGEDAALALAQRVRERGGTVVATGGCFDLLHAGHVSVLRAARALGDCLIVLLNSDGSMRRLKGPDRPLVEEGDRAAVLGALDAVDGVVIFEEDTPAEALARLRPDIFAKGGDYAGRDLPETEVLERHGGRVVALPYVAGRSTTRLIEEVALRGAG